MIVLIILSIHTTTMTLLVAIMVIIFNVRLLLTVIYSTVYLMGSACHNFFCFGLCIVHGYPWALFVAFPCCLFFVSLLCWLLYLHSSLVLSISASPTSLSASWSITEKRGMNLPQFPMYTMVVYLVVSFSVITTPGVRPSGLNERGRTGTKWVGNSASPILGRYNSFLICSFFFLFSPSFIFFLVLLFYFSIILFPFFILCPSSSFFLAFISSPRSIWFPSLKTWGHGLSSRQNAFWRQLTRCGSPDTKISKTNM